MDEIDNFFMKEAYNQALKAQCINEVPIGCVIVQDNKIIATGYNERNTKKNALYHAELSAINKACKVVNDWRLEGCTIYVTLEPCPMCAGAILQARIDRLVYGAVNPKAGSVSSILNLLDNPSYNHRVAITQGIMEQKCAFLMSSFFTNLRKNKPKA